MRGFWGLLLLLALASCQPLQWAEGVNKAYYARKELGRIEADLAAEAPTFRVPTTLYLTDRTGAYRGDLEALLKASEDRPRLRTRVAFLMGDGAKVVAEASDTIQLANGYLLLGNSAEAERLMTLVAKPDPATTALIALQNQDTLGCMAKIREVLTTPTYDPSVRVEAARLWTLLDEEEPIPHTYLATYAPSGWEQFMHLAQLGEGVPSNRRELAWTSFVRAMKSPSIDTLKEAEEALVLEASAPWRDYALERLLPFLYQEELWVEALEVLDLLPEEWRSRMPYRLLRLYAKEIQLLGHYERGEDMVQEVARRREGGEGTFWQQWGNVPNEDNWAMEQGNPFTASQIAPQRPTKEQYEAIRQHLRRVLSPDGAQEQLSKISL